MSETKHTPGPWKLEHDWVGLIAITGANGAHITSLAKHASGTPGSGIPVYMHGAVQSANARLIAAAPDLLRALRGLIEWEGPGTGVKPEWDDAYAAVAKAEGRDT